MDDTPFRTLVIGDPHLKSSAAAEYKEMIQKVTDIAKRAEPDLIVILGDVLHEKQVIRMRPLCDAISWFNELYKVCPLAILIGNHDRELEKNFDPDLHPFTALRNWDRDKLILVDSIRDISFGSMRFIFVLYVEPGLFATELSKLKKSILESKPVAIFAHQEFKGGRYRSDEVSQVGDTWSLDNPLVISGHLHKHHQSQPNIYYAGTVRQIAVDEDEDKGVTIFDFYNNGKYKISRVKTKIGLKRIVNISCNDLNTYEPPKGIQVVLRVKGSFSEVNAVMKSDTVKKLRRCRVRIEASPIPSENKTSQYKEFEKLSFIDTFIKLIEDDERAKSILKRLIE